MRIGILGFGIVGKSFYTFLKKYPDKSAQAFKSLLGQTLGEAIENVRIWDQGRGLEAGYSLEEFSAECDVLFASAAVDISSLSHEFIVSKIVTEVDFFHVLNTKQTITVTGSIGKTTLVQLISDIFKVCFNKDIPAVGNIGTGLCDLIGEGKPDRAVLELSSFQLEHAGHFTSDIFIVTNLYPNHLDRHKSMQAYIHAKLHLLTNLKSRDNIWLPGELLGNDEVSLQVQEVLQRTNANIYFVHEKSLNNQQTKRLKELGCGNITIKNGYIMKYLPGIEWFVCPESLIPNQGYRQNWLYALGALYLSDYNMLKMTKGQLEKAWDQAQLKIGSNRVELCGRLNGADCFNDSKATIVQATGGAVHSLARKYKRIHLIVAGLDKGVSRTKFLQQMCGHDQIVYVWAVGTQFEKYPQKNMIVLPLLEDVFKQCRGRIKEGDAVLFSPGGSSFDHYKNYKERGNHFKRLVAKYSDEKASSHII